MTRITIKLYICTLITNQQLNNMTEIEVTRTEATLHQLLEALRATKKLERTWEDKRDGSTGIMVVEVSIYTTEEIESIKKEIFKQLNILATN